MYLDEINGKYSVSSIRLGAPVDTQLGSELDSIAIVLTQVDEIDIHQNDIVEYEDFDGTKYQMIVAKFQKKYVSFNPVKYDYEVYLMSLTKKFEYIPMPSRTTTNIGQNRTVEFFIKQGLDYWEDDYEDPDSGALYPHLDISQTEMPTKLTTMVCPELKFEKPTLREYLDALYQLAGCICVLKYKKVTIVVDAIHDISYSLPVYYLSYLDLNERKSAINTNYIDEMYENESADGYASDLETQIDSFISANVKTEYQVLKSNDGYVDTNNACLILDNPIYDLKSVLPRDYELTFSMIINQYGYPRSTPTGTPDTSKPYVDRNYTMNFWYKNGTLKYGGSSGTVIKQNFDIDIIKYIVLEDIYNALDTAANGVFDSNQQYEATLYKNDALCWKRGGNSIEAFFKFQSKSWIFGTNDVTHIQSIIFQALMKKLFTTLNEHYTIYIDSSSGVAMGYYNMKFTQSGIQNGTYLSCDADEKKLSFKVKYIPTISSKNRTEKDSNKPHHIINTNNSDGNIDISSFLARTKEILDQSGNPSLEFNAIVPNGAEVEGVPVKYEIGQIYNDYVLIALEKVCFLDYIYYKGVMTKNYVCENMFTQIEKDKRYYSLTSSSESVIRHEYRKTKLLLSLSNEREEYELNSIEGIIAKKVEWIKITSEITNNDADNLECIKIPNLTNEDNMISYTIEPLDNAVVGIAIDGTIDGTSIPAIQYVKYVDDNGETTNIRLDFFNSIPNETTFAKYYPRTDAIPNINTQTEMFSIELEKDNGVPFLKDNRENLRVTFQANFESTEPDLIIGPYFSKLLTKDAFYIYQVLTNDVMTRKTNTNNYTKYSKQAIFYDGDYFYICLSPYYLTSGSNLAVFCDEGLVLGINNFSQHATGGNTYLIISRED